MSRQVPSVVIRLEKSHPETAAMVGAPRGLVTSLGRDGGELMKKGAVERGLSQLATVPVL